MSTGLKQLLRYKQTWRWRERHKGAPDGTSGLLQQSGASLIFNWLRQVSLKINHISTIILKYYFPFFGGSNFSSSSDMSRFRSAAAAANGYSSFGLAAPAYNSLLQNGYSSAAAAAAASGYPGAVSSAATYNQAAAAYGCLNYAAAANSAFSSAGDATAAAASAAASFGLSSVLGSTTGTTTAR